MMETRELSPLAAAAALLTTGTTAAQIAAELEAAAAATEARWQEMAPYWAVRAALWQDAEKVVAADRALAFLAGTPFVSEAAATVPAAPSMVETTIAPEPPLVPVPPKAPASSFVEAHFAKRAQQGARKQVMNQDRTTLAMFFETRGDRPFAAYERNDFTEFRNMAQQLPQLHGKSPHYRDRPVKDIIAEADRRNDPRRLKERTSQRHFSALRQFFKFGVDQGQITKTQRADLLDDFEFRMERGAREQRDEWTVADLTTLFTSPIYTGCRTNRRWMQGPDIIRDARFWIPLLALFHGGRLEEYADLYRRDIGRDDGTWFMDIREWAADGVRRTLKTQAATRRVPLHPELLKMGFVGYVEARAPRPNSPLFPDLARRGADGKRGPAFTKWFGHYRKAISVFREGVAAHSFRHNAITRLNAAVTDRQQERHADYLMGHEPSGSEGRRRYDKGPSPSEAAQTLALLRYPELDFSHLYPKA